MAQIVDTTIAAVKMSGSFAAPDFTSSEDEGGEENIICRRPRSGAVSQVDVTASTSPAVAFAPRSFDSGEGSASFSSTSISHTKGDLETKLAAYKGTTKASLPPLSHDYDAHGKTESSDKSQGHVTKSEHIDSTYQTEEVLHDTNSTTSTTTTTNSHQQSSRDAESNHTGSNRSNSSDNGQTSSPEILSSSSSPVMVKKCDDIPRSGSQTGGAGGFSYTSGVSVGSNNSLREIYQQSRFNPFDRDIHLEEDHFSRNTGAVDYFGPQSSSPRSVQSSVQSDPWFDHPDSDRPMIGQESDEVTFAELGLAEDHFAHPEGHFGLSRTEELELAINNCKELIQTAVPNSDRQKNLIRKLVQLRLKLQEMKEGPEPVELDKVVVMGHRFQRKESRSSKYYCEKCNSIIWGVVQEWRRCTECGYRCHDKCVSQITRTCASVKVKENPTYILDLCPRNPKGLATQDFRCAECRAQISGSEGSEARLCEYNGRYYCELCHWNDLMYLPAQILHNWDFEKRKVCRVSKQFLKLMMKRAVIRVQDINPMLFNYVEQLNDIKTLREELLIMKKYIMACPTAMKAKLLLQLSSRPHFVECSDRYSMQDLLDSDEALIPDLVQVHASWAQHIKTDCERCQGRGYICELCTNDEVLFPFDNIAVVCSSCSNVMHRICFAQKVMCPRCERRKKRKEQEKTT